MKKKKKGEDKASTTSAEEAMQVRALSLDSRAVGVVLDYEVEI